MKASEEERFRELAAASLPWLTRTATALTGDAHRGDDLVQEALVKAYVHWRKVRSADNPPAYLRRILVRCHLDAARAASRRETPSGHQLTGSHRPGFTEPMAHDSHGQLEDRLPLLAALSNLTAKQRAVIVLRFIDDLDVASTATTLDISPGTVKSTTHDALRILRTHLTEPQTDAPTWRER
jgi:RNA polymerase sigma-70 factor (sigma-E family)